jgi:hypothetical protein
MMGDDKGVVKEESMCLNCNIIFYYQKKDNKKRKYCSSCIKRRRLLSVKKYQTNNRDVVLQRKRERRKRLEVQEQEKIYNKKYRKEHREEISKQEKEYRINNKEIVAQRKSICDKNYREKHKEEIYKKKKEYYKNPEKQKLKKKYREEHKEDAKRQWKLYYIKNTEYLKKKAKDYVKKNIDAVRMRRYKYHMRKYNTDAEYRIRHLLRSNLRRVFRDYIKQTKQHSSSMYGIDYNAIIEYLKPFPDNIRDYHIDHIIPLIYFNFVNVDGTINEKEIKIAFAPENHQWLLKDENLSKGKKITQQANKLLEVIYNDR